MKLRLLPNYFEENLDLPKNKQLEKSLVKMTPYSEVKELYASILTKDFLKSCIICSIRFTSKAISSHVVVVVISAKVDSLNDLFHLLLRLGFYQRHLLTCQVPANSIGNKSVHVIEHIVFFFVIVFQFSKFTSFSFNENLFIINFLFYHFSQTFI